MQKRLQWVSKAFGLSIQEKTSDNSPPSGLALELGMVRAVEWCTAMVRAWQKP